MAPQQGETVVPGDAPRAEHAPLQATDPWDRRAARLLNLWAAAWMALLGVLIIVDVTGRAIANLPIAGVPEIVAASIVGIAFLQLPYAVLSRMMLRTTVLRDALGPASRRAVETFAAGVGVVFFALLAFAAWEPMVTSLATLEYEGGEGFHVPVYPIHALVFLSAVAAAYCYARRTVQAFRLDGGGD